MWRASVLKGLVGIVLCASVVLVTGFTLAQWYPQQPQQPSYPAQQAPQYPSGPQLTPGPGPAQGPSAPPPQQPAGGVPPAGQVFSDAFGRFRVNLPQGAMPMGATYNFANPQAMTQISIQATALDQMFQMNMQGFPGMMRQMGAKIDHEQQTEVRGRQARFIAVTMKDQGSGTSMHSMNMFITQANIWIQVMGPEQNASQLQQAFQAILAGLQF